MNAAAEDQINAGEDSLMDTIANLVGVLIILVAIVGMRADKMLSSRVEQNDPIDEVKTLQGALDSARSESYSLEAEASQLEQVLSNEMRESAKLAAMRHQKLTWIEIARRQLAEMTKEMDAAQTQRQVLVTERTRLQQRLTAVRAEMQAIKTAESQQLDLIHYPTPIVKTVFSEEVHFRLERGALVHVPIDELLSTMKAEWKYKAEKLRNSPITVEFVGPIENFQMEYELVAERDDPRLPLDQQHGIIVRFNRFVIRPVGEPRGESVDHAISPDSAFRKIVDRLNPDKTTISIWVYPDSYTELATLKTWLREHGFQTACWPLDAGKPITGGPNGLRSTAQ